MSWPSPPSQGTDPWYTPFTTMWASLKTYIDTGLSGKSSTAHNHAGTYDPVGTAATADAAHVAASDPHPAYLKPVDVTAGSNVTVTDNGNGTITVASTGGGSTDPEIVRDTMAAALVAGSNITITPNDGADTITIAASGGGASDHGALTGLADDDHPQYAKSVGVFDVTRYGATGNGSTDDTAAINSAIAAVNASTGGVLLFPAGDYKVTASLTAITKPCTVRGQGRSEWYSISESVSKISTTSPTATVLEFASRSCSIEHITIHNKNYSPAALSVSPGLGGFPVPLPTALVGTLPTAGAGVKVTVGDGFRLHNVVIAGFYDNLDQVSGVNVVIDELQSWAPVRYGHRIRNEAWVDAGGTNIARSFYFGNPKYSQGTYGIKWESGGGLWVTACGFSGMGSPGGGGSQRTGMAYAVHTDFATAGSSNLQVTACGIEAAEVGVYATKGSALSFFHIQIEDIQFSPWFVTSGAGTYGVYIAGSSAEHIKDVRISGVFTNFPGASGAAVRLSYVDNASLDLQAGSNGPAALLVQSNCTGVVNKAAVATTVNPGLLPALNGNSSNYLRGDGTWGAPVAGSYNGIQLYRVARWWSGTTVLTAGVATDVPWSGGSHTPSVNEIGGSIDVCTDSANGYTRFTIPSNGYYRFEAFIGAYDTNRLTAEWFMNGATSLGNVTATTEAATENWCAAMVSTGWAYFAAGAYLTLRVVSEDSATIYGDNAGGWVTVEKRA